MERKMGGDKEEGEGTGEEGEGGKGKKFPPPSLYFQRVPLFVISKYFTVVLTSCVCHMRNSMS